jgi:hypothetical protein
MPCLTFRRVPAATFLTALLCTAGCTSNKTSSSPTAPAHPPTASAPTSTAPPPGVKTWSEQSATDGSPTFTNPTNASGPGQRIAPMQTVQVLCRIYAPQIASSKPDGWWYKIATQPWNGSYFAVANTFWNGDTPGHKPYTHSTDLSIKTC